LQASSVPLLEGMYIAMDGIENLYARQVLEQAADTVRQGHPLQRAGTGEIFPPTMLYMVASGGERRAGLADGSCGGKPGICITASNYVNAVGI
jgi:type II secretory pathway component PulF